MPEFGYRDPNYRSPYLHHAAPAPEDISAAFRDDLIPAPSYVDAGDTVHVITTLEAR